MKIGIILNGVTGRMGTNQHLVRSILAIRDQGGVLLPDGSRLVPDPILTGRNANKLSDLAKKHGVERFSTDLDAALADPYNEIFFDASGTPHRIPFLERAIAAGKHVYCEKPTASV
ncbi:MAG: gfo/Idh/MocA family oxidoreductase, partial [Akkermansiaceae bacterium]